MDVSLDSLLSWMKSNEVCELERREVKAKSERKINNFTPFCVISFINFTLIFPAYRVLPN